MYQAMFTLGAKAQCQSTILAGQQYEHTFLRVFTPEFGDSVRARVRGLDHVVGH